MTNHHSNMFYNVFVTRGSRAESYRFQVALRGLHPDAIEESSDECFRHVKWLQSEIKGFTSNGFPDDVTTSYRFMTSPAKSHMCFPASLANVTKLLVDFKERLDIGYIAIDRQRVPYAAAIAQCTDTSERIVGFLGKLRNPYFRILRHFNNDELGEFFEEYLSIPAEGHVAYQHQPQWNAPCSPLRLEFLTDDPRRSGWGFGTAQSDTFLVKGGLVNPIETTLCVQVTWRTALALLDQGDDHGVLSHLDEDGVWVISAYALRAAGLIDDNLNPTHKLSSERCRVLGVQEPISDSSAMIAVLKLYSALLVRELMIGDGPPDRLSHLRDHLKRTTGWVLENGVVMPRNAEQRSHVKGNIGGMDLN